LKSHGPISFPEAAAPIFHTPSNEVDDQKAGNKVDRTAHMPRSLKKLSKIPKDSKGI
jgi:hypothetical protein